MNKEQLFIDGIANLGFAQGAFRFDLATYGETIKTEDGKTSTRLNLPTQVIMTPQGFIQAVRSMQRFIDEVEQKGIIRINKNEEEEAVHDETTKHPR